MLFTVRTILVAVVLTLIAAVAVHAVPLTEDSAEQLATVRSCKELCGSCGCLGFYCGDECLCECDGEGEDADGQCIERMQDRCESLQLPFEVLIQGSNGNRLVRSLFADPAAADNEAAVCIVKDPAMRQKRSTFSIYKPNVSAASAEEEEQVQEEVVNVHSDEVRVVQQNQATLRDVQEFLSEIGSEVEYELIEQDDHQQTNSHDKRDLRHRELQETERSPAVHKRDASAEVTEASAAEVVDVVVGAPASAEESSAVAADEPQLGSALKSQRPPATTPAPPTTPKPTSKPTPSPVLIPIKSVTLVPFRKQQLTDALEQLRSKLVTADGPQLAAMRARKDEVKAKLLAKLEASKQQMAEKAADAKQKLEAVKELNAQKGAEFRAMVASRFMPPTDSPIVVQPTTESDGDAGDSQLGAAPGAGLNKFGAVLQPALQQLRTLLQPAAGAANLIGAAVPGSLNAIGGAERALLQQIKAKAYMEGLGAKANAKKQALRKKLLAKPGLGAWARSLAAGNPNDDQDDTLGSSLTATETATLEVSSAEATTASAGLIVQPEGLIDE